MVSLDYDAATRAAEEAARIAGEQIRRFIGRPTTTTAKSSPNDLVTEVDKACQEAIEAHLRARYPDSAFLSEEAVAPGSEAAAAAVRDANQALLWVVDPIDGTLNFIRGLPACTVAIGLIHDESPVVGVIYDPLRDEMFSATAGIGAYLNGQRLAVSTVDSVAEAVLASGFPTGTFRGRSAEQIRRFGNHARNVRALGSAALHLAYVAAGRLDGFWENDLNAWDLCAGAVLVQEAGGRVTDSDGGGYTLATRHVVATNGRIHALLLRDLDVPPPSAPQEGTY